MAKRAEMLDAAQNIARRCDAVARVLRSVAHPVRLKILSRLAGQERSVSELIAACGTSQSAMSQFLKRMKTEGLIDSRRERHFVFYRIADPKLHQLMRAMSDIFC
jgi:ArsR family transcriptional regulator